MFLVMFNYGRSNLDFYFELNYKDDFEYEKSIIRIDGCSFIWFVSWVICEVVIICCWWCCWRCCCCCVCCCIGICCCIWWCCCCWVVIWDVWVGLIWEGFIFEVIFCWFKWLFMICCWFGVFDGGGIWLVVNWLGDESCIGLWVGIIFFGIVFCINCGFIIVFWVVVRWLIWGLFKVEVFVGMWWVFEVVFIIELWGVFCWILLEISL